jgi:hypothetical protein
VCPGAGRDDSIVDGRAGYVKKGNGPPISPEIGRDTQEPIMEGSIARPRAYFSTIAE